MNARIHTRILSRPAIALLALASISLQACGGGGGSSSSTLTGEFVDSAVSGAEYVSGELTGMTSNTGGFSYESGANVQFSIGGIALPAGAGRPVLTPVDLVAGASDETNPTVTNIARFLQTIDDDANATNGITITAAVRAAGAGLAVNFAQTVAAFEADADVQAAIVALTGQTQAGMRALIPAAQAQNHLSGTLLGILAGSYQGTYSGDDTGTWSIVVDNAGAITGTGFSNEDQDTFGISGNVSSSGDATFLGGTVTTGATFAGSITRAGVVSGTWENAEDQGTFSGNKS